MAHGFEVVRVVAAWALRAFAVSVVDLGGWCWAPCALPVGGKVAGACPGPAHVVAALVCVGPVVWCAGAWLVVGGAVAGGDQFGATVLCADGQRHGSFSTAMAACSALASSSGAMWVVASPSEPGEMGTTDAMLLRPGSVGSHR